MADDRNLNLGDYEDYGQEIVDLVREVKELRQGQQTVQTTVSQVAVNEMFKTLDSDASNWETINRNPGFLQWLSEVDPMTGVKRQTLLDNALATFDGHRAATFFTTYAKKGNAQDSSAGSQRAGAPLGGEVITREQYLKAQKDMQTGRMTPEKFEKLANQYMKQLTAARQR